MHLVEFIFTDPRLKALAERGELDCKTPGAAGMDLFACVNETVVIQPGDPSFMIDAGFKMWMKDPNMAALVLPRSGLGTKGLVLGNLVGLIDSDYQGPMKINVWNRSDRVFTIEPMDRIAQLVFVPVLHPMCAIVDQFSESTQRGEGGFGSTGIAA